MPDLDKVFALELAENALRNMVLYFDPDSGLGDLATPTLKKIALEDAKIALPLLTDYMNRR